MDERSITLIGIALTFLVSLANLIYTVVSNRQNIYVNTVTTLRSKWLDQMKTDLAEFISLISDSVNNNRNIHESDQIALKFNLERIYRKIQLNINPEDDFDRKLIELIEHITRDYNYGDKNQNIQQEIEQLVELTQKLAKIEWEGIKLESVKGNVSKKSKQKLIRKYLDV